LLLMLTSSNLSSTYKPSGSRYHPAPPSMGMHGQNGFLCLLRANSELRLRGGKRKDPEEDEDEEDEDKDNYSSGVPGWESSDARANPDVGDGPAARMMKKMGWAGGGLGRKGQGIKEAISATGSMRRDGIGANPDEEGKKTRRTKSYKHGDILFSDISEEDSSDYLVGKGADTRRKKKRWEKKLDEAMGKTRVRKEKIRASANILDANDKESVDAFTKAFDAKYQTELGSAKEAKRNRTNWQELDRETRNRAGMRGVGEAKLPMSASDRRKQKRKARIFDLREKHRAGNLAHDNEYAAGQQDRHRRDKAEGRTDERDFMGDLMPGAFEKDEFQEKDDNDDEDDQSDHNAGVAPGEHFDPGVPYIDVKDRNPYEESGRGASNNAHALQTRKSDDHAMQTRTPHEKPMVSHSSILREMSSMPNIMDDATLHRAKYAMGTVAPTRATLEKRGATMEVRHRARHLLCMYVCVYVYVYIHIHRYS
jgi:hypothetical protein